MHFYSKTDPFIFSISFFKVIKTHYIHLKIHEWVMIQNVKNTGPKHRNTVCQSRTFAAVLREDGGDVVKFKRKAANSKEI